MPPPRSSDDIFNTWTALGDGNFAELITATFGLQPDDGYVYRAESFAMTLAQIQETVDSGKVAYRYQSHGQKLEVSAADITAYTSIFSPATDTSKALTSFSANAKKASPRATVAVYLQSRRIPPSFKVPKAKGHVNPYYDFWVHSCHLTSFVGPLPDASYASPINAKRTHPILPVFYHHFGCIVPTYEAQSIIAQLAREMDGVIDMGSGNGYWTYMLRRIGLDVVAVDNFSSEYRTMWISDTVRKDGVEYLRQNDGGRRRVLLLVYMVTAGDFTKKVIQSYRGDIIVAVGTQNANRYTGFSDCIMDEWFEREMADWQLLGRVAMPSFAGKDEGLFVWKRVK